MRRLAIGTSFVVAAIAVACTGSDPVPSTTTLDGGGSGSDSGVDSGALGLPAACDPNKDFGAPTQGPFAKIDTAQFVEGAQWVIASGLTVYYATNQGSTNATAFDLWQADRLSQDIAFDNARPVPGLGVSPEDDRNPVLHANGRILYFARLGGDGQYDMMQSILGGDGTWGVPTALTTLNTAKSEYPSAFAGGKLWYSDESGVLEVPIDDDGNVGQANRYGDLSSFSSPVPTADLQILYYASGIPSRGLDVYRATQSALGRWLDNAAISAVNTSYDDRPRGISIDGCQLYLVTSQSGQGDLLMAERPK